MVWLVWYLTLFIARNDNTLRKANTNTTVGHRRRQRTVTRQRIQKFLRNNYRCQRQTGWLLPNRFRATRPPSHQGNTIRPLQPMQYEIFNADFWIAYETYGRRIKRFLRYKIVPPEAYVVTWSKNNGNQSRYNPSCAGKDKFVLISIARVNMILYKNTLYSVSLTDDI